MSTKKIKRINFGKIEEVIKPPNLIEIQVDSYREFLQIKNQEGEDMDPKDRRRIGLQAVFEEVFPIKDRDENCNLYFLSYEIGKPKVGWLECLREGLTFGASLHVKFRLEFRLKDENQGRLKDEWIEKEEKVFMGDIPLMTPQGTFIVNGAERVIVSQLHRSPGLEFKAKPHDNGKMLHAFRIIPIPNRGSWYEAQFDTNDMLWVHLDRKRRRKFLATTFFRALGYGSDAEILKLFYEVEDMPIKKAAKLDDAEIQNRVPTEDVWDDNGRKVAHAFEPLSKEKVKKIAAIGEQKIRIVDISFDGGIIIKCFKKDPTTNQEEALKEVYRCLRQGDPFTAANARAHIKQRLFFDPKRYDLGSVGRYKINQKLGTKHWSEESVEELGITDSTAKFLKERKVETVGSLVLREEKELAEALTRRWSEESVEELGLGDFVAGFLKEQKVKTVGSLAGKTKGNSLKEKDWKRYVESKIQNYLKKANIKTVGDLVEKAKDQLRGYPGYTKELFKAIEEGLENYGKKQGANLRIGMPSLAQRKKALNANVDELEFSEGIQECLKRAKISTVKDLVKKTQADLADQNAPKQTKTKPTIKDLYDLFDLGEKATPEQIKKNYREKISEFDPDTYAKAHEKLRAKAEEWTKRIGEAKKILEDYQKTKEQPKLDKEDPDYWNREKYWRESSKQTKQTLDAEDVKEIEEKLKEFGRKNDVKIHLGMSPSKLDQLEQDLKQREQDLDRLERALKKKIGEIQFPVSSLMRESKKEIENALRKYGEKSVQEIEDALRRFGEKRFPKFEEKEGRFVNLRLGMEEDEVTDRILEPKDLAEATKSLLQLKKGKGIVDDIDHLGRRRVRTVGELLASECLSGLKRMERSVKEQMLRDQGLDTMTPQKLIKPKALFSAVRDFFGRSQLSQFMDQINPLAELTHKRRLSALGPGGLSRERAGFKERDVHPSHYGRICPIETPEGPNIGLIASLAAFARVNDFGFIETPYRKVSKGRVTQEIEYLTADQEEKFVVAQANTSIKENGELERAMCRKKGDFVDVDPLECQSNEGFKDSVHYMDVSPKQLVSVAAGLIPFLEHDDANRALMGSNMQRQAVPLLATEAPFVGTGLEKLAAQDSRSVMAANDLKKGIKYKVASVNFRLPNKKRKEKEDNSRYIVITKDGKLPEKRRLKHDPRNGIYLYQLRKFMRSNAATCINQRPLVKKGQFVKKGDVIADGPCTDNGELALGRNVLCAFMPWNGYNFEDAVLISRRIVKDDVFTSIHIDDFEVIARDTKLGPEEITRDIPNLGEEALKDLDADGIIREGAEVKPGDILVGKVTPKSETELAPEDKLLRAIFGAKAADIKDSSLRVPSGTYGIVMEVRSVKKENERDSRSEMSESKKQAKQIEENYKKERKELRDQLTDKLSRELLGEKIPLEICNSETTEVIIPAYKKITKTLLKKLADNYDRLSIGSSKPSPIRNKINEIIEPFKKRFEDWEDKREEELERVESGVEEEEEETGVVKSVKVFIASKRKLSVGDKMAGRHGNKGVVAQIVPEEDMPFLANGTPVDIVLNPLGVPSRMNVGQVLETHLGWAAKILGVSFATPIFDGIKENSEEKENKEKLMLHELLKKWKDQSLSAAPNQKELEKLREKLREYGVRDYLKAADDLVKEKDGVAWDFGMASSSSGGSADRKKKKKECSLVKEDGKAVLYDGRTGERFNQEVVVGYIYMLKLGHLVADKIHARAVGPYSLVTQQPLGGKAQYGGQRFGEMEVWAMEAYGAAHALQELITVKSDDVQGRTDIYASVVNGDNSLNARVPESFNVLVKEIKSLGMDVQVVPVQGRERAGLSSLAASPTLDSELGEPRRVL